MPPDPSRKLDPWLEVLGRLTGAGLVLAGDGDARADSSFRESFGCADEAALQDTWTRLRDAMHRMAGAPPEALPDGTSLRLVFEDVPVRVEVHRAPEDTGGLLVAVHDLDVAVGLRDLLRRAVRLGNLTHAQAAAAHDVKAPLNSMTLNLQLVRRVLARAGVEDGVEYLDVMQAEMKRLDEMLLRVLGRGRPARPPVDRLELNQVLDRMARQMRPLCQGLGVSLELRPSGDRVLVQADEERLEHVLMNLVANALEAVGAEGTVRLLLRQEPAVAVVRVEDTGPGLPADRLRANPEPAVRREEGGGLGLEVVRNLVRELGGVVRLSNPTGGGCAIEVELPLASGADAKAAPPAARSEGAE